MRDFTNTYDAFMHCDVNKLAEAFALMYHSEGKDCDRRNMAIASYKGNKEAEYLLLML